MSFIFKLKFLHENNSNQVVSDAALLSALRDIVRVSQERGELAADQCVAALTCADRDAAAMTRTELLLANRRNRQTFDASMSIFFIFSFWFFFF